MALEDLKFIAHEKTCEDHFAPTCPQEDLVTCILVENSWVSFSNAFEFHKCNIERKGTITAHEVS